jgi:hypothetical protein
MTLSGEGKRSDDPDPLAGVNDKIEVVNDPGR